MAVSYKVGSFAKTTSGAPTSQAVTGVGFEPKALVLFTKGDNNQDIVNTHMSTGIGFTDGTTEKAIWVGSETGIGTTDCYRYPNSSKTIMHRNPTTGALAWEADLTSFDADGFTLNFTTNNAVDHQIYYIAIGGDDITDVEVGSFTSPSATTGIQNVATGISNADFVMMAGVGLTTQDTLTAHSLLGLGIATSSSNQGAIGVASEDGVSTSDTFRYQRTNKCITRIGTGSATVIEEAGFDSFTASGFNINWTTSHASAYNYYYLTIKGGKWEVGNGTTPTSVSTKAYTTTFQPKGLGLFGNIQFGGTTTVSVQSFYHLGAADDTNNVSIAVVDRDAISTTDSGRVSSSTKCFQNMSVTSATRQEADLHSFNATDYTLNFTKVDGDAREFIWFVVGDEPVVEDGGGAGPAGSSKQVGVSLVDKQIRDTVPPKKKRLLESQFVLDATLVEKVEIPTRVHSTLKALCADSELTLSGEAQAILKASMSVSSFPLANLSARLEATGKAQEKLTTKIETDGEPDYSNLDRIIQMAKLLED